MKINLYLILGVLSFLIMISLFIPQINSLEEAIPDDIYSCQVDNDCIAVKNGCCGCSAGGSFVAINKDYQDYWNNKLLIDCKEIGCAAVMSNNKTCFSIPKCLEGFCGFSHNEYDICKLDVHDHCLGLDKKQLNDTIDIMNPYYPSDLNCNDILNFCSGISDILRIPRVNYREISQPIKINNDISGQVKDASLEKEYYSIIYLVFGAGIWFVLFSYILVCSDKIIKCLKEDNITTKDQVILIIFVILTIVLFVYIEEIRSGIITFFD